MSLILDCTIDDHMQIPGLLISLLYVVSVADVKIFEIGVEMGMEDNVNVCMIVSGCIRIFAST